jgi:hypothetical protein
LWLSANQRKPLVPLVSSTDEESGHKVLTCVLLPQLSPAQDNGVEPPEQAATLRRRRSRAGGSGTGGRTRERPSDPSSTIGNADNHHHHHHAVKFVGNALSEDGEDGEADVRMADANGGGDSVFCHLNRIPTPLPRDMKAWARNRLPHSQYGGPGPGHDNGHPHQGHGLHGGPASHHPPQPDVVQTAYNAAYTVRTNA